MDTPETTTTGVPAVLEIQKKKTTKTFPEEVVIEAKFQVLVSCLDGGGQHKWWIRGKTARWSKTYGQKILSTIIWPRKNIVCKHTAKKKYCLQSNGRQKNIASNHLANKKYCLQSYGQQKNIPQKRILSANQSVVYCQYQQGFWKYLGQLLLCLWHNLYLSILLHHHIIQACKKYAKNA